MSDADTPLALDQAIEMTNGDLVFLREILVEFMEHSRKQVDTLVGALEEGNKEKLRFEAHAIKGSSATVGATHLSQAAFNLERAASGESSDDCGVLVQRLREEFQRVWIFVEEFLKEQGAPPAGEEPAVDMQKALQMTGDDPEFLKEILCEFMQHSARQVATLREGIAQNSLQVLRFEAHAIKGSAATIGAAGIASAAVALEKVASNQEKGDPAALVDKIAAEFDRVREFMRQHNMY